MKWEMGILSPSSSSYLSSSSWFNEESNNNRAKWTPAENKAFEKALALYDKDTPERWQRVAEMVPGKTVADVIRQYKELEDDVTSIEAGLMDLIPIPDYTDTSSFTLERGSVNNGFDSRRPAFLAGGKRPPSNRAPEHERKKGVPWTEEEHKLFLMGLKKYGKGDWRSISRNFVITRTPTQVASHAQKFFIRQNNAGGKDKRRASIHDITTVGPEHDHHQMAAKKPADSPDSSVHRMPFMWNHHHQENLGNLFSSPYGLGGAMHESIFGSQAMAAHQYPFA